MTDEPFPAMPPDPELAGMYRFFESQPGELSAYGGMADMMDERGYPALAHAFRWCWKRQRYPHKREWYCIPWNAKGRKIPKGFRWGWYRETTRVEKRGDVYPQVSAEPHSLPRVLILQPHKYYASHQAAVMDLAKWLDRIRGAYELDPKGEPR